MSEAEIPFTTEHIVKIEDGEKISTLRKVKEDNVYHIGEAYSLDLTWVLIGGYIQERTFRKMAISRRPCERCEGDGYL